MFSSALSHFKTADPKLYQVAKDMHPMEVSQSQDFFLSLTREIVGQQLSGRVADVIYGRFIELFPKKRPTVEDLLAIDEQKLRDVGMAWAKVRSLKDLATKISTNEVQVNKLLELDNEAVVLELTKVKGIGPWTAEMFLMFALGREDVFSPGDLGLRNGIIKLYGLEYKPTHEQMLAFSHKWAPYRTYACLILWKHLDNFNPPVEGATQ